MEMVAAEDVKKIGQDLTPPLSPLAFSLHDSYLHSHCSSCFSPLSPPTFPPNSHHVPSYCSPPCSHSHFDSDSDSLHSHSYPGDSSDLRTALRLLQNLRLTPNDVVRGRIRGLMSNREKLIAEVDDVLVRVKEGAKAIAAAARGVERDGDGYDLEEEVLCVVLTNAVEVQDKAGRSVGIAVYGHNFSWINHSCSPNACYWFLPPRGNADGSLLLIAPAAAMSVEGRAGVLPTCKIEFADGTNSFQHCVWKLNNYCVWKFQQCVPNAVCNVIGYKENCPKIVLRSIKAIQRGEAITIAYTDLLQPKARRQSDLWLKYRFTCKCARCSAMPLNYVDHALQEISAHNLLSSSQRFDQDKGEKKLTDYIDDCISEYISYGDAVSCCHKLENVITDGLLLDEPTESSEGISHLKIWLHPLHHLSLNAYTVLASAYKVQASDLSATNPLIDECHLYAFRMKRISAAYALLLAGLTHHLFLSEFSLVASVANFWTGAGESLLDLSRNSIWSTFAECQFSVLEHPSFHGYKCSKCTLLDKFAASFGSSETQNSEIEYISREFLNCIASIMPKVWSFLVQDGCSYLGMINNPIDYRWLEAPRVSTNILDFEGCLGSSETKNKISGCKEKQCAVQERISIIHLSVHCLLYGGFLSNICGGQDSDTVLFVHGLLCEGI